MIRLSSFRRAIGAGILAAALAGCHTTPNAPNSTGTFGVTGSMLTTRYSVVPGVNPVILGAGAAAIVNALLPNWSLEELPLGNDRYRIFLRKKTFSSGGDGEAAQLFKYRAEKIAALRGYEGYEILEYTEGLDSGLMGTRKVAQGLIRIHKTLPADGR